MPGSKSLTSKPHARQERIARLIIPASEECLYRINAFTVNEKGGAPEMPEAPRVLTKQPDASELLGDAVDFLVNHALLVRISAIEQSEGNGSNDNSQGHCGTDSND